MIVGHIVAALATALGDLFGGTLYVRSVLKGETKPHAFTWLVWGLLAGIAGAVAYVEQAYWSAFVIFVSCILNFTVSFLGLWRGEKYITRSDIGMLFAALSIIPVWVVSKEPLTAALLVSFIDLLALCPTFRKSWNAPFEENQDVFAFFTVTGLLGVLAVTPFTLTAALYPTVIFVLNFALTMVLVYRRREKRKNA